MGPNGTEVDGGLKSIQLLRILAYLTIVIAGLKMSGTLFPSILMAALLAIVCLPAVRALDRRGIPTFFSIPIVVTGLLLLLLLLVFILGTSIADFTSNMDRYEERLEGIILDCTHVLERLGVNLSDQEVTDLVDPHTALSFVASAAGSITGTLSDIVVVVLFVVFMLFEAQGLPLKLRRALGGPDADLSGFEEALGQVYGYLAIKTVMSLITGIFAWGLCAAFGVDVPVLWGLVAFLFNFIPNIGSILAAIPPMLLATVQFGFGRAGLVALGYTAINFVIGNALEPRVMGRRLGLSPLVVLLSLIFWSWLWGPIGMLLSVPLTTAVKILLEHSRDYKAVATILGPVTLPGETLDGS